VRSTFLRLALATICLTILGYSYARLSTPTLMSEAANAFLDSLDDQQKAKAKLKFDDEDRFFLHFIPSPDVAKLPHGPRRGITFQEMTAPQRHLAHALINASFSQRGAMKASTIMSLDDVLRIQEKDTTGRRNSDMYFISIFGTPAETGDWGMRIEGHHITNHFTIHNGKVVASPTFFGSNPAEVKEGPRKGLRALPGEEDAGRALMLALSPAQQKEALVAEKAYNDILTSANRVPDIKKEPNGLSLAKFNAKQKELVKALVDEYAANFPEEVAAARRAQFARLMDKSFFAWAGVTEKGGPHYYRVATPEFLIEYDCTQNGANHIHAMWRDYKNDWGQALLKEPMAASR
jgi:hypothetical protein